MRYTPSQALDLSKVNFSYQYDLRAPVQAAQRVVNLDEGITVFIKIDADSIHRRRCVFLIQDDYKSSKHDTLSNYAIDTLFMKHNQGYFKLTLPAINESIFILSVPGNNQGEFYLFETEVKSLIPFPTMYPVDENGLPIFTAYISNEKSKLVGSDKFHVYAYNENFSSADPPMGSMGAISPTLEIDSSFFIGSQLSGLDDFKFYLLQEDTLEQSALTLLKCPEYFPKLKTIPTLVEPLRYITTQSEIKSLTKNYTKKSFEVFWINTYGTKFRAKSAIKLFYDAVEETNLLFTDYKQGWKTDRGMLYLIFGAPDRVIREARNEKWTYSNGVTFEFIRISTLFAPTMYSLRRDRKYENLWYNQIGEIRKGL